MNIVFSKKIYSKKAIKKAIVDYEDLASFDVNERKTDIEVTLSKIDTDVEDVIKDEFSNHVLAYMKSLKTEKQND